MFRYVLLKQISSIETRVRLGHKELKAYSSGSTFEFKSFDPDDQIDVICQLIEGSREPMRSTGTTSGGISADLTQLMSIYEDGHLTVEEFALAKQHLLTTGSLIPAPSAAATKRSAPQKVWKTPLGLLVSGIAVFLVIALVAPDNVASNKSVAEVSITDTRDYTYSAQDKPIIQERAGIAPVVYRRSFTAEDFHFGSIPEVAHGLIVQIVNRIANDYPGCADLEPMTTSLSASRSLPGATVFYVTCNFPAAPFNVYFDLPDGTFSKAGHIHARILQRSAFSWANIIR